MGSREDLGLGIQGRSGVGDSGKISGWIQGRSQDVSRKDLGMGSREIWECGSREDLRMGYREDLGMGSREDLGLGIQGRSQDGSRKDLGMGSREIWECGSREDLGMGSREDLGMGIQGRYGDGIGGRPGNQLSSVYGPDGPERLTANSSQFVPSTSFICNESSFCYIQINLLDLTINYVLRTFSGISCPPFF